MPKQFKDYKTFHGGLNSKTSEFDLKEGELTECVNWGTFQPGKIFTQGQPSAVIASSATPSNIAPAYGLLPVSLDEFIDITGSSGDIDISKDYIVCAKKDGTVTFLSTQVTAWDVESATMIDMDSASLTAGVKPILTIQDGVIRVSDSAHNATCRTKGLEYIDKKLFKADTTGHNAIDAWVAGDRELVAPVSAENVVAGSDTDAVNVIDYRHSAIQYGTDNGTYDPGIRVKLDIDVTGSGGRWESTDYEFAMSYVYTGNQESLPTVMKIIDWEDPAAPVVLTALALDLKEFWTGVQVSVTHVPEDAFDKRILGARVYIRKIAKNTRWGLLLDVNFGINKSVRTATFDLYSNSWTQSVADHRYYSATAVDIKSPSPETYLSINGFNYDEPGGISFPATDSYQYSAVAIVNKRMWIANAKFYDENGVTKTMGDRLFYTPANKLDTFLPSFYIDIGMNDGENFTALAGFGNRLFCFKQHNLYIVNVAGALDTDWALEGNFKSMGILNQSHVVTTDIGLAWFNTSGCYFWSGEGSPKELTGSKLTSADWNVTVNGTIGYDFINKQVIVVKDATGNSGAFSYDLRTQSWQEWEDYTTTNCTNLITLPGSDSSLVHIDGTALKKYVPTIGYSATTLDSVFKTKKDDFGSNVLLKKAYNIYYTVTTSGTMDLDITVYTNTGTHTSGFDNQTTSGAADGVIKKLDISSVGNFQWMKLGFANASTAQNIQIEDISIEFRPIRKRAG